MATEDIVTFYQMCDEAQEHFQQHFGHVRTYKLRFQQSPQARKYVQTLKDVEKYLRGSLSHAANDYKEHYQSLRGIENFLDKEALQKVSEAFEEGVILIGSVLAAISNTKEYLFTDMTPQDFLRLVQDESPQTIHAHLLRCKEYVREARRGCEQAERDYQRGNGKSHADILEELIAAKYKTSKNLNKFEDDTDQHIRQEASEKLEEAWEDHLKQMKSLERVIVNLKEDVKSWEEKYEVLEAAVGTKMDKGQSNYQESAFTPSDDAKLKCIREVSDKDLQKIEEVSMIDEKEDKDDEVAANAAESPVNNNASPREDLTDMPVATLPTEASETTLRPIIISLPETEPNDLHEKIRPNTPPDFNLLLDATDPPTAITHDLETPEKEDSFVFISKRAYEYDHNKENTPTVSLPLMNKDKESWGKAFAGLDQYARNLFSRSPSVETMPR